MSPRHGRFINNKEDGSYRIEGVSAGIATLELTAPGYAAPLDSVPVRPGQTTKKTYHLESEGILRGVVRRNGEPSAHGYIIFPDYAGHASGGTNKNGEYEVKGLAAGEHLVGYTMWLYEDQRGGAQATYHQRVHIESGQTTNVDIEYNGTGIIHGTFSGMSEHNWRVGLYKTPEASEKNRCAGTWKFQENGVYEIPGVPPGTYTIVATSTDDAGEVWEQSQTLTLGDGAVEQVDFSF